MPVKHSLNVVLTEPLVRYVREKVVHGDHPTIRDVVRASLRASIALEEAKALPVKAFPPGEDRHDR